MDESRNRFTKRRILILVSLLVFITIAVSSGAIGYRVREFTKRTQPQSTGEPTVQTRRELILEESTVIQVVKKVSPSVVSIAVSRRVIDPFSPFSEAQRRESGIGTGFIISKDGLIITNRHVVADPDLRYIVVAKADKKFFVQKIFRDPVLDIAILKIDANDLTPVTIGDSSAIEVGQLAIAVGNALGRFQNSVTTGVISGIRPEGIEAGDPFSGVTERLGEVIQTDAAINPGNSGGPLLDSRGTVIGVNVAVTQGAQNIGFAIPVNSVKSIIDEFLATGKITRPYLGVRYEIISKTRALAYEVPEGAYIREVIAGSPAEKTGIKVGDIILKINGQSVSTDNPLSQIIQSKKIGDAIELVVDRDDTQVTVTATLAEAPSQF